MKHKFLMLFVIIFFAFTSISDSEGKKTNQNKGDLINTSDQFTKNGKIKFKTFLDGLSKYETGFINGIAYRFFYSDGSGTFSGKPGLSVEELYHSDTWHVAFKKDPIDDTIGAVMSIKDLIIYVLENQEILVGIGTNHNPGSEIVIRFGNELPIKGGTDGILNADQSKEIIEKLKTAKQITTRYQNWPYKVNVDKTWELYGFTETLQYINWAISKIK